MSDNATSDNRVRNAALFGGVAVLWFILDYATKIWANVSSPGTLLEEFIPGVLDFRLVHNTGAAWGVFGGSTFGLGAFAVVFCLVLLVVVALRAKKATAFEMIGYALVFAGGLGNAIDRFVNGYVIDFLQTTFIDFPVFNVADIGVTCGFVIIIVTYLLSMKEEAAHEENPPAIENTTDTQEDA